MTYPPQLPALLISALSSTEGSQRQTSRSESRPNTPPLQHRHALLWQLGGRLSRDRTMADSRGRSWTRTQLSSRLK